MTIIDKTNWYSEEPKEILEAIDELKDNIDKIQMVYVSGSAGKHKYIRFDINYETQKSENQGNLNGA